jgi:hypothetical protein
VGHIKRKITEYDIPDRQNLKSAITHIFDEIGQETHIAVLETWINRLEWVAKHEGKYFHQSMKNERKCLQIQLQKPEDTNFLTLLYLLGEFASHLSHQMIHLDWLM